MQTTLPPGLSQWRVAVSLTSQEQGAVDAFLLDCTGKEACIVAATKPIGKDGAKLVVDDPKEGDWRVVIRTREQVKRRATHQVRQALLVPNSSATQSSDEKYASGATWSVPLPPKQSDMQYAAFRIAGTPGKDSQKNGLRIAMTPLEQDAP